MADKSNLIELNVFKVDEQEVQTYVDVRNGAFAAIIDDNRIVNETYDGLCKSLTSRLRSASRKISVPFALASGELSNSLRKGVIIGVHAGDGRYIVRWDDGKKDRLERHLARTALRSLSSDEAAELAGLQRQRNEITTAIREFLKPRSFNADAEAQRQLSVQEQAVASMNNEAGST